MFFDPGRVKHGILPNRQMGRPLEAGERVTLVVRKDWTDAHGRPLASEFRHEYRVVAPDERPLDTAAWRISSPAAGSRDPLEVTFPEPLDHGLLYRTVGVAFGDTNLVGDVRVESGETRWVFVPRDAWAAGDDTLVVLPVLEDPSGNRIGRAFEVVSSGAPEADERQPFRLPFRVGAFQSK